MKNTKKAPVNQWEELKKYQEQELSKLRSQLAYLESLYVGIFERTAKLEYETFGPRPKPDEASNNAKKPLQFVNVDVVEIGTSGHFSPGPVCIGGTGGGFKPGDKVKVTVESYPSST